MASASQTAAAHAADEYAPLLGAPDTAGGKALGADTANSISATADHDVGSGPIGTPAVNDEDRMPYGQVILLCFAATVDSVSYFAIFPIIGDMLVKSAGLDVKDIALWSGIIETVFSVVQMLVMIAYGKLADRVGRKPVLVFSLVGIAAAQALFGMSQSLWQMVLLRCVTGFFAGSSVCVRTMLSEVTTKKTQARAFSWYMFARSVGIFIGPLIGGSLASPEENIPLLHGNAFFRRFPFSLSLFATASFTLIATLSTAFFIKETLKSKHTPDAVLVPAMSTRELLQSPGVMAVIYIYAHVQLVALMHTAVASVFYYTPIGLGGLGLAPNQISIFIALVGAAQSVWMLGPFPPLQKRFGTGSILRGCAYAWPVATALYPTMNEIRRADADIVLWIALPVGILLGSGVAMSFACVQLALNDVAPTFDTLGTLNAIALAVSSAVRAFAPILATAIFEFGIKAAWLDGHLFWIILIGVCLALIVGVYSLPEKAEGRVAKPSAGEEPEV